MNGLGTDAGMAFMVGLLGSAHCLGMCGALVAGFFIRMGEGGKGMAAPLCYHGARIGTYMAIGALAALLGMALVSTGLVGKAQAVLQILAGLVVMAFGFDALGWLRLPVFGVSAAAASPLLRKAFGMSRAAGAVLGGLVNGLMPCGMTMAMAAKAAATAHPGQGALLMLAFGLGGMPALALCGAIFGRLGATVRRWLLMGAALAVIVMGAMTVMRGGRVFDGTAGLHHGAGAHRG